jgi:hypothetical protein
MPYKMPPHELEFYQELMAPWADEDLSVVDGGNGKKLTYVDKEGDRESSLPSGANGDAGDVNP